MRNWRRKNDDGKKGMNILHIEGVADKHHRTEPIPAPKAPEPTGSGGLCHCSSFRIDAMLRGKGPALRSCSGRPSRACTAASRLA